MDLKEPEHFRRKKKKVGRLTLPDFKIYYEVTVTKTEWYWHKDRRVDELNRRANPETDAQMCDQLIFDKLLR